MKQPNQREEKPSLGRRIMRVAAPAAIIGGTLAYKHYTRSGVPTQLTDPAKPKLGGSLIGSPRKPLHAVQPTGNPRSRRWLSDDQIAGRAPIQKPGILHEGSGPSANAPLSDIAKRTSTSDALLKEAQIKARRNAKAQKTVQERQAIKDAKYAADQFEKDKASLTKSAPAATATTATPAPKPAAAVVAQPPVRKVLPNNPPAAAAPAPAAAVEAPKPVAPKEDLGPPLDPGHPKNVKARERLAKQVARRNGKSKKKEPVVIDVNKQQAEKLKARRKNKALARANAKIAEIKGKKELAARLRAIRFNLPNEDFNNMMGVSDRLTTAYRKGRRIVPWIKRGTQAAEDIGDVASGKKVKDPFWKKSWAKSAMIGAAIGAPILAARKINKWHRQDQKFPNSLSDMSPKLGRAKEHIVKAARGIDEKWINAGLRKGKARQPILTSPDGPFFASKIKNPTLLQAVLRTVNFRAEPEKKSSTAKRVAIGGAALVGVGAGTALALRKPKVRTQVGLLPFKGYKLPARVKDARLPKGVGAAYASPGAFHRSGLSSSSVTKEYGPRAMRGGVIFTNPGDPNSEYNKIAVPRGYGSMKNVQRRALRHELIHSIRAQRHGDAQAIVPLVREEIAAYTGSNRSLKGMPEGVGAKIFRGADIVNGTIGSTQHGINQGMRKLFKGKIRPTQFEYADALDKGWDLRDARGRSARVYAPGSRKRVRREKNWDEKTDNIRLVRNIAIAGALAGAGGTAYYRHRYNKALPPKMVPNVPDTAHFPVPYRKLQAKVRAHHFETPAIQRITSAIGNNLPEREPTAPEQAYAAIQKLPPRARRGLLRYLGAGTLAGAGVVGGLATKRPKTGALIGGLAAGLTLG